MHNRATSFRIRQKYLKWYVFHMNNAGVCVKEEGPYVTRDEAMKVAGISGLLNADHGGLAWQEQITAKINS